MKIRIKKLHPNAITPKPATDGAACFDLHAATVMGAAQLGANIEDGHPVACGTGLSFEIPDGYAMLIFSRSGHGFKHGIRLANCVGIIDSDYRGEVAVKLTKDYDWGDEEKQPPMISPGDRVAQAMVVPVPRVVFEESDELAPTVRGTGGFGSSGA